MTFPDVTKLPIFGKSYTAPFTIPEPYYHVGESVYCVFISIDGIYKCCSGIIEETNFPLFEPDRGWMCFVKSSSGSHEANRIFRTRAGALAYAIEENLNYLEHWDTQRKDYLKLLIACMGNDNEFPL